MSPGMYEATPAPASSDAKEMEADHPEPPVAVVSSMNDLLPAKEGVFVLAESDKQRDTLSSSVMAVAATDTDASRADSIEYAGAIVELPTFEIEPKENNEAILTARDFPTVFPNILPLGAERKSTSDDYFPDKITAKEGAIVLAESDKQRDTRSSSVMAIAATDIASNAVVELPETNVLARSRDHENLLTDNLKSTLKLPESTPILEPRADAKLHVADGPTSASDASRADSIDYAGATVELPAFEIEPKENSEAILPAKDFPIVFPNILPLEAERKSSRDDYFPDKITGAVGEVPQKGILRKPSHRFSFTTDNVPETESFVQHGEGLHPVDSMSSAVMDLSIAASLEKPGGNLTMPAEMAQKDAKLPLLDIEARRSGDTSLEVRTISSTMTEFPPKPIPRRSSRRISFALDQIADVCKDISDAGAALRGDVSFTTSTPKDAIAEHPAEMMSSTPRDLQSFLTNKAQDVSVRRLEPDDFPKPSGTENKVFERSVGALVAASDSSGELRQSIQGNIPADEVVIQKFDPHGDDPTRNRQLDLTGDNTTITPAAFPDFVRTLSIESKPEIRGELGAADSPDSSSEPRSTAHGTIVTERVADIQKTLPQLEFSPRPILGLAVSQGGDVTARHSSNGRVTAEDVLAVPVTLPGAKLFAASSIGTDITTQNMSGLCAQRLELNSKRTPSDHLSVVAVSAPTVSAKKTQPESLQKSNAQLFLASGSLSTALEQSPDERNIIADNTAFPTDTLESKISSGSLVEIPHSHIELRQRGCVEVVREHGPDTQESVFEVLPTETVDPSFAKDKILGQEFEFTESSVRTEHTWPVSTDTDTRTAIPEKYPETEAFTSFDTSLTAGSSGPPKSIFYPSVDLGPDVVENLAGNLAVEPEDVPTPSLQSSFATYNGEAVFVILPSEKVVPTPTFQSSFATDTLPEPETTTYQSIKSSFTPEKVPDITTHLQEPECKSITLHSCIESNSTGPPEPEDMPTPSFPSSFATENTLAIPVKVTDPEDFSTASLQSSLLTEVPNISIKVPEAVVPIPSERSKFGTKYETNDGSNLDEPEHATTRRMSGSLSDTMSEFVEPGDASTSTKAKSSLATYNKQAIPVMLPEPEGMSSHSQHSSFPAENGQVVPVQLSQPEDLQTASLGSSFASYKVPANTFPEPEYLPTISVRSSSTTENPDIPVKLSGPEYLTTPRLHSSFGAVSTSGTLWESPENSSTRQSGRANVAVVDNFSATPVKTEVAGVQSAIAKSRGVQPLNDSRMDTWKRSIDSKSSDHVRGSAGNVPPLSMKMPEPGRAPDLSVHSISAPGRPSGVLECSEDSEIGYSGHIGATSDTFSSTPFVVSEPVAPPKIYLSRSSESRLSASHAPKMLGSNTERRYSCPVSDVAHAGTAMKLRDLHQADSTEAIKAEGQEETVTGVLCEDVNHVSPADEVAPVAVTPAVPLLLEHFQRPGRAKNTLDRTRQDYVQRELSPKPPFLKVSPQTIAEPKFSVGSVPPDASSAPVLEHNTLADALRPGKPANKKNVPPANLPENVDFGELDLHSRVCAVEERDQRKLDYEPLNRFTAKKSGMFSTCRQDTTALISPGTFGPLVPGPQKTEMHCAPDATFASVDSTDVQSTDGIDRKPINGASPKRERIRSLSSSSGPSSEPAYSHRLGTTTELSTGKFSITSEPSRQEMADSKGTKIIGKLATDASLQQSKTALRVHDQQQVKSLRVTEGAQIPAEVLEKEPIVVKEDLGGVTLGQPSCDASADIQRGIWSSATSSRPQASSEELKREVLTLKSVEWSPIPNREKEGEDFPQEIHLRRGSQVSQMTVHTETEPQIRDIRGFDPVDAISLDESIVTENEQIQSSIMPISDVRGYVPVKELTTQEDTTNTERQLLRPRRSSSKVSINTVASVQSEDTAPEVADIRGFTPVPETTDLASVESEDTAPAVADIRGFTAVREMPDHFTSFSTGHCPPPTTRRETIEASEPTGQERKVSTSQILKAASEKVGALSLQSGEPDESDKSKTEDASAPDDVPTNVRALIRQMNSQNHPCIITPAPKDMLISRAKEDHIVPTPLDVKQPSPISTEGQPESTETQGGSAQADAECVSSIPVPPPEPHFPSYAPPRFKVLTKQEKPETSTTPEDSELTSDIHSSSKKPDSMPKPDEKWKLIGLLASEEAKKNASEREERRSSGAKSGSPLRVLPQLPLGLMQEKEGDDVRAAWKLKPTSKRGSEDEYFESLKTNRKEAIPWSTKPSENKAKKKKTEESQQALPPLEALHKPEDEQDKPASAEPTADWPTVHDMPITAAARLQPSVTETLATGGEEPPESHPLDLHQQLTEQPLTTHTEVAGQSLKTHPRQPAHKEQDVDSGRDTSIGWPNDSFGQRFERLASPPSQRIGIGATAFHHQRQTTAPRIEAKYAQPRKAATGLSVSTREFVKDESFENSLKSVKKLIKAKDRQLMIMKSSHGQSVGPDDSLKVLFTVNAPKTGTNPKVDMSNAAHSNIASEPMQSWTPKIDYLWEATPKPIPGPFLESDDDDLTKDGSRKASKAFSNNEPLATRWRYSTKLSKSRSASELDEKSKASKSTVGAPTVFNLIPAPNKKTSGGMHAARSDTLSFVSPGNPRKGEVPYAVTARSTGGVTMLSGAGVAWYNEDDAQQAQDQPTGLEQGHGTSENADGHLDGNAEGELVTKEELERYLKIARDLKLRRGSLLPPSGTLQSSDNVTVPTKKKPSIIMETRIELYGKGRVTFSFDAVAEEGTGTGTGSMYPDDSQTNLVRRGAPSTSHTPRRMSIDVRAPQATPASTTEALYKRSKSVDFGYNKDEESMQYEPQEPPNAVSQAARRRHSEHGKPQPGDDLKKRRHSEPGTLSASKEGEETSKVQSVTDGMTEPTLCAEDETPALAPCAPCEVLQEAENMANAAIAMAALEARMRKAETDADQPLSEASLPPEQTRQQPLVPAHPSPKQSETELSKKPKERPVSAISARTSSPGVVSDEDLSGYATCESRMGIKSSEVQSAEDLAAQERKIVPALTVEDKIQEELPVPVEQYIPTQLAEVPEAVEEPKQEIIEAPAIPEADMKLGALETRFLHEALTHEKATEEITGAPAEKLPEATRGVEERKQLLEAAAEGTQQAQQMLVEAGPVEPPAERRVSKASKSSQEEPKLAVGHRELVEAPEGPSEPVEAAERRAVAEFDHTKSEQVTGWIEEIHEKAAPAELLVQEEGLQAAEPPEEARQLAALPSELVERPEAPFEPVEAEVPRPSTAIVEESAPKDEEQDDAESEERLAKKKKGFIVPQVPYMLRLLPAKMLHSPPAEQLEYDSAIPKRDDTLGDVTSTHAVQATASRMLEPRLSKGKLEEPLSKQPVELGAEQLEDKRRKEKQPSIPALPYAPSQLMFSDKQKTVEALAQHPVELVTERLEKGQLEDKRRKEIQPFIAALPYAPPQLMFLDKQKITGTVEAYGPGEGAPRDEGPPLSSATAAGTLQPPGREGETSRGAAEEAELPSDVASQKEKELTGKGADFPAPEEVESSGGPAEEAIQLNLVIRIAPVERQLEKEPESGVVEQMVVGAELTEPVDVAKQQVKPDTIETPEAVLNEEKRVREILDFEVTLCRKRNLGSTIPKVDELLHVGTPVGEPSEYAAFPDGQPTGTTAERSESIIPEEPTVLPEQSAETEAGDAIVEVSHLNKGPMSDWETELQRLRDSRLHETPHRTAEDKQITKPQAEGASPGPSAWSEAGVPTSEPIVIVYEKDVLGLLTPEYEVLLKNEREIRLRPAQQQETSTEPTWLEGPAKAEDGYLKSPDIHHVSFPTDGGHLKEDEAGAPKALTFDEEKEAAGALVEREPSIAGDRSSVLAEKTLEHVPSAESLTLAEVGGPDEKRTFLRAGKELQEALPVEGQVEEAMPEERQAEISEEKEAALEAAGASRVFLADAEKREPFSPDETALVERPAEPEESQAVIEAPEESTEPILPEKQVEQRQDRTLSLFESREEPNEVIETGKAIAPEFAVVERPESSEQGEVVPVQHGVEEGLASSMAVEEPKTYGGTSDWDIVSRESLLHVRPSTRTADTQTELSTDVFFRSKDVREASTYAFLSEENEEVRRAPDDYLPLYLHRVTLNDKPSIAEMIRKLTPASEEWEEAVPMNWKVNPAKDLEKWPSPCIQDVRSPIIVLLGGINLSALGEVLTGCLILRYNIEDNEWRRCNMMPLPRYGHRCVFLNNEVYIIGGFDNRDATYGLRMSTSFCFRYHVQTGEWNVTAPLKHARGYHGVAVLNNSIYAVGGVDANDLLLSSVERYDQEEDKWVVLEKGLYCGRMGMGVAAFQGSLWVVGGIVQISGLQTCSTAYVEIYNPATDQWTYAANYLPSPRTCVSLLNVNDKELYCFGGIFYNCVGPTRKLLTIDDILVYSEKKKVWRQVSCMPAPRHNAHVLQYQSQAFVVGGQDVEKPDHPLTSIMKTPVPAERFSWGPLRDVPLPISAYGAVVIPPLEEHV